MKRREFVHSAPPCPKCGARRAWVSEDSLEMLECAVCKNMHPHPWAHALVQSWFEGDAEPPKPVLARGVVVMALLAFICFVFAAAWGWPS